MIRSRREILALASSAVLLAAPVPVRASGFQLFEQNASGIGNAFAGQAAGAKDASAIYFNPANLMFVPGKQFVLVVDPVQVRTTFSDTGSTRPFLPSSPPIPVPVALGGAGGDAGGWVPVPNGYVSWQAGSRAWVGLGVNVPFGLKTDWDPTWVGRFKAIESEVRTINVNPTLAVKVADHFSIGAGASYQRLKATLSQSVAYGGITLGAAAQAAAQTGNPLVIPGMVAQLGSEGLAREGVSQVEGDDWSWGFNVGASLEVGKAARLAASYRSRIKHDITGDAVFANRPTFATAGPLGALGTALNGRLADGPVNAHIELPETASVAAAYEAGKVEVLADYTWTGWSSIETLAILRTDGTPLSSVSLKFDDTWRVGLGVNCRMNDAWTLRLGTAYDNAPVSDLYRTPRLPDQNRTWAAAGFQYRLGSKSAIDFGYAHVFVKEASSNLPNQDAAGAAPTGNLVGAYGASVNILGVQFRRSF